MTFPDRVRLPIVFDPDRLAADLARLSDAVWIDHFVKQNYDGIWDVLPLRSDAGATHPIKMIYSDPMARAFVDGPLMAEVPYMRAVIAQFRCPVRVVRLMRLRPGSAIKEHNDHDLAAENGSARLHVPIVTNPDVEFLLNGVPVAMAVGSAWYLRLSDPHAVTNRGATDRVHLVIDVDVDDWLIARLHEGVAQTA